MYQQENKNDKEQVNLTLHDILLKQQALLLQQSEYIAKEKQRMKEESDEIDLSRLVPGFLKKKKKQSGESSEKSGLNINLTNIKAPDMEVAKKGIKAFNRGIKVFWSFLSEQFDFFMMNRFFVIGIALIGFIYGIVTYINSPKVYRATMTLASGDFDNTYYANLIAGLEELAKNESYIGLANKLNLDTVITKNITNISYQDYFERYLMVEEDDSLLGEINRPYFKVSVEVYNNSMLPYIENALFNFLKENKYVNKKVEIKKKTLQNQIASIDYQLASYDSLKNAVIKNIQSLNEPENSKYQVKESGIPGSGIIFSQEDRMKLDPLKPFDRSDTFSREKISKERELLVLEDNFDLVDGLAANAKPVSPKLMNIIMLTIYAFILGLILPYLFLLIKYVFTYKATRKA